MPEAARYTDEISHTSALAGLLAGLAAGAVVGLIAGAVVLSGGLAAGPLLAAACTWGGVAAAATGASMGAGLGQLIGSCCDSVVGMIASGDPTVEIGGLRAACAIVDIGECSKDPSTPHIAQGSATVWISCQPAARKGDKGECSFKISSGCETVLIGGPQETYLDIEREVPLWLEVATVALGIFGPAGWMRIASRMTWAAISLRIGGGLVGGYLGGNIGNWAGGRWFGEGSDGQKITAFLFAWAGSTVGSDSAARWGKNNRVQTHIMPQRTAGSDQAAQTVATAMKNAGIGGSDYKAVGVTMHIDGKVTYTLSGDPAKVAAIYSKLDGKLPANFFPGRAGANSTGFRPVTNKSGKQTCGTQCAEPKLLRDPVNKSHITGMSILWRGNKPNNYPWSPTDKTFMCPCASCRVNMGEMQSMSKSPIPPVTRDAADAAGPHLRPFCCGELPVELGGGAW